MARYTQNFTVKIAKHDLHPVILECFKLCDLAILYQTDEYILAQELIGQVSYHQLVNVEILINQTWNSGELQQIKFTCVTKNAELPLREHNHCRAVADLVHKTFLLSPRWQILGNTAG
ncbi:MAG: hypothetical protein SFT94_09135 [Pseudanabaenaceae cyanobacterium bins.68]|nr:hypothetical protein [Pseudanabaenaceae cyanobacterium bins.68]